jgi:DNA-binding GntR family transcriptional regulator
MAAGRVTLGGAAMYQAHGCPLCFFVQRLAYDAEGRPAEYVSAVMRGDRYRIRIGLRPPHPPG